MNTINTRQRFGFIGNKCPEQDYNVTKVTLNGPL